MLAAQAPVVPDASSLAGLDPVVAVSFLGVVALGMILFYFGPALRERLSKKAKPADPAATAPMVPLPVPATQMLDRTAEMTDRYVDSLKEQLRDQKEQLRDQQRELADQDRELARLRAENTDLLRGERRGAP